MAMSFPAHRPGKSPVSPPESHPAVDVSHLEALSRALADHQAGKLDEAASVYRAVLQTAPDCVDAWQLLGTLLLQQDRASEAIDALRQAIRRDDTHPAYHSNLAEALRRVGALVEAEASVRRALEIDPEFVAALTNLGLILFEQGRYQESLDVLDRALERAPSDVHALNNRGRAASRLGRRRQALDDFQQALRLQPAFPEALLNLGMLVYDEGQYHVAEQLFAQALKHRPTYAMAGNNLGMARMSRGDIAGALAQFAATAQRDPTFLSVQSNALLASLYSDDATPESLLASHRAWAAAHAEPLRSSWRPHANDPDPRRPLRIGFVSADLYRHPIGFLVERLFSALDVEQFSIDVYATPRVVDHVTERLRASSRQWRTIQGWSDAQLAEQIRADAIDVLVDLSGHTGGHRLLTFARRPAPVQLTWLGYPATTGLSAIDYLLADAALVPQGAESAYAEQVVRLPEGNACYAFPEDAPDVEPPPVLTQGVMTYGSFNSLS